MPNGITCGGTWIFVFLPDFPPYFLSTCIERLRTRLAIAINLYSHIFLSLFIRATLAAALRHLSRRQHLRDDNATVAEVADARLSISSSLFSGA